MPFSAGCDGKPVVNMLSDRVVFFGADLIGDHDVIAAPPHGLVGGTQFHAMAFDNLMTYGDGYFHAPSGLRIAPDREISGATGLGLLAWIAVLLLIAFRHKHRHWVTALAPIALITPAAIFDLLERWNDDNLQGVWLIVSLT